MASTFAATFNAGKNAFQSRCRDWVVGENCNFSYSSFDMLSFSLVAEIGWLASHHNIAINLRCCMFQSRCRDWVVGECFDLFGSLFSVHKFQSRCRDWVVGELNPPITPSPLAGCVSVSLPRLGGWRELLKHWMLKLNNSFSLVAEIGWLAS